MPSDHVVVGHPSLARSPVMRRLYELAKSRGVFVAWYPLPERYNGMFFGPRDDDPPTIILNPAMRGRFRSFVFAHELGHYALGNGGGFDLFGLEPWDDEKRRRYRQMEEQTDEFARRLLFWVRRGIDCQAAKQGIK